MRKIFFVIGPSGSGKTTLVDNAVEKFDWCYSLKRIVGAITRPPRENEVNGKSFWFCKETAFDFWAQRDFFIEWEEYAGLKHGLPKNSLIPDENLIKEITPAGLSKVLDYAEKNGFRDEIVIISITAMESVIIQRLKDRGMSEEEIKLRLKEEANYAAKIEVPYFKPDHIILNEGNIEHIQEKFNKIIEKYLVKILEDNIDETIMNLEEEEHNMFQKLYDKKRRINKMINVQEGSVVINHKKNPDGRFIHILVDSESDPDKVYYTTWDTVTGKRMGCTCPQASMFPFIICKHQKAVIKERLLGE